MNSEGGFTDSPSLSPAKMYASLWLKRREIPAAARVEVTGLTYSCITTARNKIAANMHAVYLNVITFDETGTTT